MAVDDERLGKASLPNEALEEDSFDELAVELASGAISRSRALKLAGAAILGGLLPSFLVTDKAEARSHHKRRCPPGFKRVRRRKRGKRRILCVKETTKFIPVTCDATHPCPQGNCVDGVCVVREGCDANNPCPPGSTCVDGVCVAQLPVCPVGTPSGCALGPPTCQCPSGTRCIGSGTGGKCK